MIKAKLAVFISHLKVKSLVHFPCMKKIVLSTKLNVWLFYLLSTYRKISIVIKYWVNSLVLHESFYLSTTFNVTSREDCTFWLRESRGTLARNFKRLQYLAKVPYIGGIWNLHDIKIFFLVTYLCKPPFSNINLIQSRQFVDEEI